MYRNKTMAIKFGRRDKEEAILRVARYMGGQRKKRTKDKRGQQKKALKVFLGSQRISLEAKK